MINDIHISEHFKLSEFQSGDTQEVKIDPKLIEKLGKLRKRVGQRLVINSGYRTRSVTKRLEELMGSYIRLAKLPILQK